MDKKINVTVKRDGNFTEVHISGFNSPLMRAAVRIALNIGLFPKAYVGLFEANEKQTNL